MIDHSFVTLIKEYEILPNNTFIDYIKSFNLKDKAENINNYSDKEDRLPDLKKNVSSAIKDILNEHRCILTDVWIQKYKLNSYHSMHVHGNGNIFSFVWFIDCTETSSEIIFHNQGYPYVFTNTLRIKPKIGKIIFFDGSIPHYVPPNKDTSRLIISGNCDKL